MNISVQEFILCSSLKGEPSKAKGQSANPDDSKDDENKENEHDGGQGNSGAGEASASTAKVEYPTVITPADYLDSDEEEETPAASKKPDPRKKKSLGGKGSPHTKGVPQTKATGGGGGSRAACRYGASCYRKNPRHFELEAHPGDADYVEAGDGGEDEDDKRPECEYGLGCYRKNPDHRRRYKHTRKPQPTRRAKVNLCFLY